VTIIKLIVITSLAISHDYTKHKRVLAHVIIRDLFHSFPLLIKAKLAASDTQTLTIHHRSSLRVGLQDLRLTLSLQQMPLYKLLLLLAADTLDLVQLLITPAITLLIS